MARNFNSYVWLPRGKALLLTGVEGTRLALWEQPLSGAAKKLDLGEVEAGTDVSVSKAGVLTFIGSTPTHPGELYVMDSPQAKPRRLTDLNTSSTASRSAAPNRSSGKGPTVSAKTAY